MVMYVFVFTDETLMASLRLKGNIPSFPVLCQDTLTAPPQTPCESVRL